MPVHFILHQIAHLRHIRLPYSLPVPASAVDLGLPAIVPHVTLSNSFQLLMNLFGELENLWQQFTL